VSETFTLQVNGAHRAVSAEPNTPLVYLLRNDLGLKGTRFGCGTGHCGACTVLMDGNAVQSCDTPLWSAAGRAITTIEGLGAVAHPHPLQQAFLDEQAGQCGYCLSGILISATALLARNPHPSRSEIAAALDRHLCRCGVHNRIMRAVARAGAAMGARP
jgi:nicotinate dehydrogenase subunit A